MWYQSPGKEVLNYPQKIIWHIKRMREMRTLGIIVLLRFRMMMSSNGNIFRVTGPLCGEFTGHWWIPHTKASDAKLWCFPWFVLNKRLSKQSWGWWFETPSRLLWHHCNGKFDFDMGLSFEVEFHSSISFYSRYGRRIPTVAFLILSAFSLCALSFVQYRGKYSHI